MTCDPVRQSHRAVGWAEEEKHSCFRGPYGVVMLTAIVILAILWIRMCYKEVHSIAALKFSNDSHATGPHRQSSLALLCSVLWLVAMPMLL